MGKIDEPIITTAKFEVTLHGVQIHSAEEMAFLQRNLHRSLVIMGFAPRGADDVEVLPWEK